MLVLSLHLDAPMGPNQATHELSAYQEPSTARIEPLEPVRVSRVRSSILSWKSRVMLVDQA
jgi:hypothetical protein